MAHFVFKCNKKDCTRAHTHTRTCIHAHTAHLVELCHARISIYDALCENGSTFKQSKFVYFFFMETMDLDRSTLIGVAKYKIHTPRIHATAQMTRDRIKHDEFFDRCSAVFHMNCAGLQAYDGPVS
jgi:hypothetical protein